MQDAPDIRPHFDDAGRLVAPRYGDRYCSEAGGLAETTHVFLNGNHLAERFERLGPGDVFIVGETGFGTGLNFLACWQLFDQHAPAGAALRFVSVEKHPLPRETMRQALSPWRGLGPLAYRLLKAYTPPSPGSYTFRFDDGRAALTLLVGEASAALSSCETPADAWFLDGFTPSRNPAMWSPEVFAQVARLSHTKTTIATYTAAGFVRRGLAAMGFEVEKRPGFGTKREMTAGRMPSRSGEANGQLKADAPHEAFVIGAGVAGSFAARALADRGWTVTVVERQPIEGGEWPMLRRRVAVVQPKTGDRDDPAGRWLRAGFERLERQLRGRWACDPRVGWDPCGVFHAAYDPARAVRLRRFVEQFGPAGLCRWVEPDATRDEVGLELDVGGVVIERAGTLRPAGLCAALLDHPQIALRPGTAVETLERDSDHWCATVTGGDELRSRVVIVANAMDALRLEPTRHLDLIPVRGQASLIRSSLDTFHDLSGLRRVLCGAGYLTPSVDDHHTMGATFVLNDTDTAWRDSEHRDVCDLMTPVLPDLAERLRDATMPEGWVGIRCTTPNRQPYAGPIDHLGRQHTGLFASLGHGSHGIVSACHAAHQIADAVEADARIADRLR